MTARPDTIAAVATATGRGGIGVVRVSGPLVPAVAQALVGCDPVPRRAHLARFRDANGTVLDEGIVLRFAAPHSYTGEDVLELQGHGGPVVLRQVLLACLAAGARHAEPGEFTRRAFLNNRLDLAQAEGVADLIDAASAEAARGAARSLVGEFSSRITTLVERLTELRLHVEACIDFPEEEIDPADRAWQARRGAELLADLGAITSEARQGAVLREGLAVVLAGAPNVGKSSLLNRLAGEDIAIVTPIPGTTRDHVRATLVLEGVPIHLVDTAGLRDAGDEVERIGIARTWEAIAKAGAVMHVVDVTRPDTQDDPAMEARFPVGVPRVRVANKIDLAGQPPGREDREGETSIALSARTGEGVPDLRGWLLEVAGWRPQGEGVFLARERHLVALAEAAGALARAVSEAQPIELFAEDLKVAQQALGRITGAVTADALLGQIFSHFCIGK